MVKATRRGGSIGERQNQENGAEDRSQLIDEPSHTEEIGLSHAPYAKSSEEDDRSLATAVKTETEEEDSDVNEQEKPKQEVEIITKKEDGGMTESETAEDEQEGLEKAQDNSSEAEIEPTEIKGMARKKRVFKRLRLPPPKKQRKFAKRDSRLNLIRISMSFSLVAFVCLGLDNRILQRLHMRL